MSDPFIENDEGLMSDELVKFLSEQGDPLAIMTVCLEEVETHRSRVVRVTYEPHEESGIKYGMLWLGMDKEISPVAASAANGRISELLLENEELRKVVQDLLSLGGRHVNSMSNGDARKWLQIAQRMA